MEIKANVTLEPIRVTAQVKAPTVSIKDGMGSGQLAGKSLIRRHSKADFPSLDKPAVSVHARRCDSIDPAYRIQHLDRG